MIYTGCIMKSAIRGQNGQKKAKKIYEMPKMGHMILGKT